MTSKPSVFLGTDSGATTSKTGGIWADGSTISLELRQSSTNAKAGTAAVVRGWVEGADSFLAANGLTWDQVAGAGLALPGPYKRYGILDRTPNLPPSFEGWDFYTDYQAALTERAGRPIPLVAGNDGNYAGVAEARRVRGDRKASVLLLAPGSGLGAAYMDANGLPLEGDTLAGMEAGHMPAPLHLLGGIRPFSCGCGRDWGCVEAYTAISGLAQLLAVFIGKYPNHELNDPTLDEKEKVLSLRGRAQKGDPLALEIFDFQARALGLHVANLVTALDTEFVVIGGGVIDPESTTEEFRARYFGILREAAMPYFFPVQRERVQIVPASLGELSQAIGAALMALYAHQGHTIET